MKPFKNRNIDYSKPVMIYRNLNCKRGVVDYSIKQGSLVVAHTSNIVLKDVEFKISKAGQLRARKNKIRNVHAFAKGYIDKYEKFYLHELYAITYNPFKSDYFMTKNINIPVHKASYVIFRKEGVFAVQRYS